MKYIYYFSTAIIVIAGYLLMQWPSPVLHIVFCDVGQGDAILLSYQSTQVLVDGGKDEKVLTCLGKHLPFWDKKLEVIIATHPDSDHIGGLTSVFAQYTSDLIATNGLVKETDDFGDFKTSLSRKLAAGTSYIVLQQDDSLSIGRDITLFILSPRGVNTQIGSQKVDLSETQLWDKQSVKINEEITSNDGSIVILLEYKNSSFLLTGDLEKQGELSLVKQGLLSEVDILKVGHHGSKTSTSPDFLQKVRPEISVISSGKHNSYNHPAPEIVALLHAANSRVYRTDELGTLHFASDGEKIWIY